MIVKEEKPHPVIPDTAKVLKGRKTARRFRISCVLNGRQAGAQH
jgi:hypothetical protein